MLPGDPRLVTRQKPLHGSTTMAPVTPLCWPSQPLEFCLRNPEPRPLPPRHLATSPKLSPPLPWLSLLDTTLQYSQLHCTTNHHAMTITIMLGRQNFAELSYLKSVSSSLKSPCKRLKNNIKLHWSILDYCSLFLHSTPLHSTPLHSTPLHSSGAH